MPEDRDGKEDIFAMLFDKPGRFGRVLLLDFVFAGFRLASAFCGSVAFLTSADVGAGAGVGVSAKRSLLAATERSSGEQ